MERQITPPSHTSSADRCVRVWDMGVRCFHWTLVAAVLIGGVTGFVFDRTTLNWHLGAGVAVMIAIVWRLIWGLLGPTYARFASFAYSPAIVLAYLQELRRTRHQRYLGHNPLGSMMVFSLLAVLAMLGLTGAIVLGGMLKQGPFQAFLSYATGTQVLDLHNLIAILLLIMVGAHIAGVAFESHRSRENLVAAMLTGSKPLRPGDSTPRPARAHPLLALAIGLSVLAMSVTAIVVLARLPNPLVPPTVLDPVYAEQCGACHLAYPPSLAPASTWNGILNDLQHHFGADATLSPEQIAQIRAWLDANAAGHWDTLPSHLFRTPAADGSLRITDTLGWRQRHRNIPDSVFTAKPVYRRGNCAACHGDASTGQFAPQDIAIPEGIRP
jgi:cytochrome b